MGPSTEHIDCAGGPPQGLGHLLHGLILQVKPANDLLISVREPSDRRLDHVLCFTVSRMTAGGHRRAAQRFEKCDR